MMKMRRCPTKAEDAQEALLSPSIMCRYQLKKINLTVLIRLMTLVRRFQEQIRPEQVL
jgi:hypothetical protein